MKIVNKTRWRSDDLKKICAAGAKIHGVSTRGWLLKVSYSKAGAVRPYVYQGNTKIAQVCVPSVPKAWPTVVDQIATIETGSAPGTVIEEIFRGAAQSFSKMWAPIFVPPPEGLLLRVQEKPAPDPGKRMVLKRKKLEGRHALRARWESKRKRAENAIKKLDREIKRLERQLESA